MLATAFAMIVLRCQDHCHCKFWQRYGNAITTPWQRNGVAKINHIAMSLPKVIKFGNAMALSCNVLATPWQRNLISGWNDKEVWSISAAFINIFFHHFFRRCSGNATEMKKNCARNNVEFAIFMRFILHQFATNSKYWVSFRKISLTQFPEFIANWHNNNSSNLSNCVAMALPWRC